MIAFFYKQSHSFTLLKIFLYCPAAVNFLKRKCLISDFDHSESFIHLIMAERPDLSSTSLGGIHDPYNTRSPRHKSATSAVRQSSGSLSLCITPSDHSLINKMLNWNKNMQLRTARSVVIDYSLKTPPVSARRGTPTGWFSNSSSCTGIQSKVFQVS